MPSYALTTLLGLCVTAITVVSSAPGLGNLPPSLVPLATRTPTDTPSSTPSPPPPPETDAHKAPNSTRAETTSHYLLIGGKFTRVTQQDQSVRPAIHWNPRGNWQEIPAQANKDELVYSMPVTVGGQSLMLQVDTGSADPYVLGPQVPSDKVNGQTVFSTDNFDKIANAKFKLAYQGGDSATGDVGTTSMGIGNILLPDMTLDVASFVQYPALTDGLIGLSVGKMVSADQLAQENPFLESLMHSLQQPLFAASLRSGAPSSYQFGYVDRSKYTGDLAIVNVDPSQGQWEFQASGLVINGQTTRAKMSTLVDTGSSLLRLRKTQVQQYYAQITNAQISDIAGGWVVPCSADLPEVGILITDSYTATVPGDYIRGPTVDNTFCLGGLQEEVDNVQSLGVVFLKSQYVLFDRGNLLLAFAPHAQ